MNLSFYDAAARDAFARAGFATAGDFCESQAGEVVSTARTRTLRRVVLGGRTYYVKTQDLRRVRLPLRKWPSYAMRGSPLAREARCARLLQTLGVRTPLLIALGVERGALFPLVAVLITEQLAGYTDLVSWLDTGPKTAAATITAAEALVASVHARGYVLLGAKYRNILVPLAGCDDARALALVDQPDMRASRSARLRAKDLGLMALDRRRYLK